MAVALIDGGMGHLDVRNAERTLFKNPLPARSLQGVGLLVTY